jgi:hypothetical protein
MPKWRKKQSGKKTQNSGPEKRPKIPNLFKQGYDRTF